MLTSLYNTASTNVVLAVGFGGGATQPPGTDKFNTLIGWIMWGCWAAAFIGLLMIGGSFVVNHRRGHGGDHGSSLGSWGLGILIIAAAGGIVSALSS